MFLLIFKRSKSDAFTYSIYHAYCIVGGPPQWYGCPRDDVNWPDGAPIELRVSVSPVHSLSASLRKNTRHHLLSHPHAISCNKHLESTAQASCTRPTRRLRSASLNLHPQHSPFNNGSQGPQSCSNYSVLRCSLQLQQ